VERDLHRHAAAFGVAVTGRPGPARAGTRGLVLGGSSGIGAAVVVTMAEGGCKVVAASRRATVPPGAGADATAVSCDVRDPDQVIRVVREVHGGGLDWVVNAAGVGYFAPLEERFAEQWRGIVEVNLLGLLAVIAAVTMLDPPIRHLVQIGSLAGTRPSRTPGNDLYAATKAAGAALLARHRDQLRAAGARTKITLITPGYVGDTDFGRNFFAHAPERQQSILDDFSPLGPADVARVVAYALTQPPHVELSEIVIRPVEQPD
jgi:NADP-dependent 3-hydroxy acid dehydrogenase YdfG